MKIFSSKTLLQVLVWLFIFMFFFSVISQHRETLESFYMSLYITVSFYLVHWVTAKFLFPIYLKDRKLYLYVSIVTILLFSAVFFSIEYFLLPDSPPNNDPEKQSHLFHIIRNIITSATVFFVTISFELMEHTKKLTESEKMLTEEKLQTELKLLKAQINPHFIFNALNNIYSLTYMKSSNAPESVLKLSEMLRYVFYDCSKDRVSLSAEISYIENYNAFQQMKSEFSQNICFATDITGGNIEIAPMLFIPFIENAFKYSRIEENENAFVRMEMNSNAEGLKFRIENSVATKNKPSSGSEMGICNVKQRLDIIYPGQYDLNIEEEKDVFVVELKLTL